MSRLKCYFLFVLFAITSNSVVAQNWTPFPCTSINYPVGKMATSGNTLYIARTNPAEIVAYDQLSGCQTLNPLPDPQMDIRAMAVYNGNLYVSGYSFDTTRIYRQNGGGWTAIGTCYQSIVNAMIVFNNELYVGGLIYEINGVFCEGLAKWNGAAWTFPGGVNGNMGRIRTFAIYNNELHAGGDAFAPTANDVAKWNGASWVPVGAGVTGAPYSTVFAMREYNGFLYVAGTFDNAGAVAVNNIARWNGSTWSDAAGGIGGTDSLVISLEVFNNLLYVGGSFAVPGTNIATFDGNSWSTLANGGVLNGSVTSMATFGNSLIVGGSFSWNSGGVLYEYILRYSTCSGTITASGPTTICSGTSVTLNAPAGNTYQWRNGTFNISGATSQSYVATTSGTYSCLMTTPCGVIPTNSKTVIVNPTPNATASASGPTNFCAGDSVYLFSNTGAGFSYLWYKYGNPIPGGTQSTYNAKTTGTYKVRVQNTYGCWKKSSAINVTVTPLPTAVIAARGSTSICAGDSVMLTASTNTPGSTFQWKKYNNFIAGATTSVYAAKTTGKYKAIVTSPAGCVRASNAIIVSVVCREIQLQEDSDVHIYPNPASEELFIEHAGNPLTDFIIRDTRGAVMLSRKVEYHAEETTIDITALAPGIYFLEMQTTEGTVVSKFVKQ